MTYVAFAIYPIVAILLFGRLRLVMAVPSVVLVGLLALPSAFQIRLPILPDLNRETWIILVTSLGAIAFAPRAKLLAHKSPAMHENGLQVHQGWIPRVSLAPYLLPLALVGPLGTWLTNRVPVFTGFHTLPGLTPQDFLVDVQSHLVFLCLFLVSWKYLGSEKAQEAILLTIAVAGLAYTFPALYEIRMSPQIHAMVYGYFPHSFLQHMRGGGFRPLVMMPHALELATFLCLSALATIAYMRSTDGDRRILYFLCAVWVIVVLVAGRSVGAALITAMLLPIIFFTSARLLVLLSAIFALAVLTYPIQRAVGLSPLQYVADAVQFIAPGRASSLEFRLNAEDLAFQRTLERPLFGWGGWGRNEVFDEESGRDLTVFDGSWLIKFSRDGLAGFLLIFGLLAIPLLHLPLQTNQVSLATAGTALLLAANLIDLVPNSSLSPITIMLAGALTGRLQWLAIEASFQRSAMATDGIEAELAEFPARRREPPLYRRVNATHRARPKDEGLAPNAQEERYVQPSKIERARAKYTRFEVRPGRNKSKHHPPWS